MHPLFKKAASLTGDIIAAAIEVHRDKGPGLLEAIYEWCLTKEPELHGLTTTRQKSVLITYKEFTCEEPLRFDLLVEQCVLVEAQAVTEVLPIHEAQLLSYMKLLNVPLGLLINFNVPRLTDGVHRLMLPGQMNPELLQEATSRTEKNPRSNLQVSDKWLCSLCYLLFKSFSSRFRQLALFPLLPPVQSFLPFSVSSVPSCSKAFSPSPLSPLLSPVRFFPFRFPVLG